MPIPVREATGMRYFQIKNKINYNFAVSVLEFCVSYSIKRYF